MDFKMKNLNQLIIKFDYEQNFKDDDFYVSNSNKHIFNLLNQWPRWEKNFLNINGEKFSGKTHLMNIFIKKFKGIKIQSESLNNDIINFGNIELINIDNLKDIVNKNYNRRKGEIEKSQIIIDSFLKEFDEWASTRQLRPSILSIKNKIKILIQNNMKIKSNGSLSSDNSESENLKIQLNKVYDKLSNHLVKKIRLASNNGKDKSALEIIKKIFNDE